MTDTRPRVCQRYEGLVGSEMRKKGERKCWDNVNVKVWDERGRVEKM